jgi:hypothetical protein
MNTKNRLLPVVVFLVLLSLTNNSAALADPRLNDQGQLAFNADGTPLPGFDSSGRPVTLIPPTDPTGIPGATKLPPTDPSGTSSPIVALPLPGAKSPTDGCLDLGVVYYNTQYEVTFGEVCRAANIEKMWKVIADYGAWVNTQPPAIVKDYSEIRKQIAEAQKGRIELPSGNKVEAETGDLLPTKITNTTLRATIDSEIREANYTTEKTRQGYLLKSDTALSAIDTSLIVTAKKAGKKIKLSLGTDTQGNLLIPTKLNLKGYTIEIKRGSKLLTRFKP